MEVCVCFKGRALSPFFFATVINSVTGEIRQESLWIMMFAGNIVICSERESRLRRPRREGDTLWNGEE